MITHREDVVSSWNYRIVKTADDWYGLHEIYYDDEGHVNAWAEICIGLFESPDEIITTLEMMLSDARNRPVLDDAEIGRTI